MTQLLNNLGPPMGATYQGHNIDPCLKGIAVNNKKQVHIVDVAARLAKRLAIEVRVHHNIVAAMFSK